MAGRVLHRRIAVVSTVVALVVLAGLIFAWWRSPARRTRPLLRECREAVAPQFPGSNTASDVKLMGMHSVRRDRLERSCGPILATAMYLDQCRSSDAGKALFSRLAPQQVEPIVMTWAFPFDPKERYDYMDRVILMAGPGRGKCYLCISPPPSPIKREDMPPNPKWWRASPQGGESAQAVLDAWGNPVVLVPGGGLGQVRVGNNDRATVRSPDGQFFFASAGPDGDFSTGDDNVYSFQ